MKEGKKFRVYLLHIQGLGKIFYFFGLFSNARQPACVYVFVARLSGKNQKDQILENSIRIHERPETNPEKPIQSLEKNADPTDEEPIQNEKTTNPDYEKIKIHLEKDLIQS